MKRYAATVWMWCRTISPSCAAKLDITGLDVYQCERCRTFHVVRAP